MKSKLFFIVGFRRSGTTLLRQLIGASGAVGNILFEPHDLWFSVMCRHFERYRDMGFVKNTISAFRKTGENKKWSGAKFALNPGIDSLDWIWLKSVFPEARIILLLRDIEDTYRSYQQTDRNIKRGVVIREAYNLMWLELWVSFTKYEMEHPKTSRLILYKDIIKDADRAMEPIWELLEIEPVTGLQERIKKPKNWRLEDEKNRHNHPNSKQD